ncbi:SEC14 family lipid-binding protein [Aspergillus stella-maris]|uniref:SEC14 family lipid-binding protein n=1 Tax=Aspergillus stella-maris TaxID=1810926 RepID=UPI003CCCDB97
MNGVEPDEASTLATFSEQCSANGLLKRPSGLTDEDVLDGISDETTLLRFLQANSLDPAKALEQFQQSTDYRAKNDAGRLYSTMSVDDFEDTRLQYPHWTGRRDRQGRPILAIDVAALNKETMAHWRETRNPPSGSPSMEERALVYFDTFTRFLLPLCSAVRGEPVTSCVYIVDVSCLGMKQAWDLREFAQAASWVLSTCFPETIHRVYACNCPSMLTTLWKILKPFVDPITAAKIQFLPRTESLQVLSQEIDPANIPSSLGGGFDFQTGMLPDLDEETRRVLDWTTPQQEIPPGTLKWLQSEGQKKAVATGTVDGETRNLHIATLRT